MRHKIGGVSDSVPYPSRWHRFYRQVFHSVACRRSQLQEDFGPDQAPVSSDEDRYRISFPPKEAALLDILQRIEGAGQGCTWRDERWLHKMRQYRRSVGIEDGKPLGDHGLAILPDHEDGER